MSAIWRTARGVSPSPQVFSLGSAFLSSRTTSHPALASQYAQLDPLGPAPTTITSWTTEPSGGRGLVGTREILRLDRVWIDTAVVLVEMTSVDQYLPILGMLILGAIFASGSFIASSLLAPHKKPSDAKLAPYECGIVPETDTPARFPIRFYLVAMIFIIFDIEVVFLYPFAVEFRALGKFGLVEIALFSLFVFGSLLFLVSEGALSWGPVKRLTRGVPARTSDSTITRITAEPVDRAA
jgi:NADH-quinone oxidoreductase subunit A